MGVIHSFKFIETNVNGERRTYVNGEMTSKIPENIKSVHVGPNDIQKFEPPSQFSTDDIESILIDNFGVIGEVVPVQEEESWELNGHKWKMDVMSELCVYAMERDI